MDVIALHRRSVGEFAARMDGLDPAAVHGRETPCAEWDVHALINHITGEDAWTAPMLTGSTIADVGDRFEGDLLGADPVGAFATAATDAVDSAERVDPARIVHLSFGDVPASEYLRQLAADHLVHAWDLAAATDGDRHLNPAVVAEVADWFTERERLYREAGMIGPRPDGSADDPQDRLLVAFGRDPSWHPHG
jgi:uncharacterized protein (TIGR03086 family)